MRNLYMYLMLPVICSGAGSACTADSIQRSQSLPNVENSMPYPQPDAALGEALYPNEAQTANEIAGKLKR